MAGLKPNIYALLVTCLGFLCLVISATAVGVPIWAYYDSRGGEDRGYFGPWQKCQVLSYRERCGDVVRFQPSGRLIIERSYRGEGVDHDVGPLGLIARDHVAGIADEDFQ